MTASGARCHHTRRSGWLARPPLPSLLLVAAWATALELAGPHHGIVIALLPLLLLLTSLVAGRYPGAETLARLGSRRAVEWRRRRSTSRRSGFRQLRSCFPRGGALIGAALAGRAPPASIG